MDTSGPTMQAVLAAHAALNVDPGFAPQMTVPERAALVALSARAGGGLAGRMHLSAKLRSDAYRLEEAGEPAADPVNGRDLAHGVFLATQRRRGDGARSAYCAWRLMHERQNAGRLYVSSADAATDLRRWDAGGALAEMVPHARRPGAVTSAELHGRQAAICALWRDARVVCDADRLRLGPGPPADGAASASSGAAAPAELDECQLAAVRGVLARPASVLCGMGGTGKSTVVARLLDAAAAAGVPTACLTPTHKAKLNIAAAVSEDAVHVGTVQAYTLALKRLPRQPPTLFVMDEASMLDVEALGDFAAALSDRCDGWQLCLVGDEEQLPPVGRGECFRTAVRHAGASAQRLERCYRAAFRPMFDFHLAVRGGRLPDGDGGVARVEVHGTEAAVLRAVEGTVAREGAALTYIAWKNSDVDLVNRLVQERATGEPAPGARFNPGDAVMYVGDNRPRASPPLTNAMTGRVERADRFGATVDFGGQRAQVAHRDLCLAYCLTVHKAQGSGYARVCVACLSGASALRCLDRRWLYTAVSRAREHVLVHCTADARRLAETAPRPAALSSLRFAPHAQ